MLTGLTGIPSPTTGGTRSIRALLAGEWRESLRLQPLAVPIVGWYFLTLALLIGNVFRHKKLRIPAWVFIGWAVLLGVSMVVKLCSPTDTW